jgi:hypothetical protein
MLDFVAQWGPSAPILLYVWVGLACALAFLKTHWWRWLVALFIYPLAGWLFLVGQVGQLGETDRLSTIWWVFYPLYVCYPWIILPALYAASKKHSPSYRSLTDVLLFRDPVRENAAGSKQPLVYPVLVGVVALIIAGVSFGALGLRTCGWVDVALGRSGCQREFGYDGAVAAVAFSPRGQTLAFGGSKHDAQLVNVADGSLLRKLTGQTNWVSGLAFSPDGTVLATLSWDANVRLWQVADGSLLRTLTIPKSDRSARIAAFSPDGKLLGVEVAPGSEDYALWLWNVGDGILLRTLPTDSESFAFSPDSALLATVGANRTIEISRLSDGMVIQQLPESTYVSKIVFSADGAQLLSATGGEAVQLWRISDGTLLRTTALPYAQNQIVFSPDRTLAVVEEEDWQTIGNRAALWRVTDGAKLRAWPWQREEITSLDFAPDGKIVAAGSSYQTVRLWHVLP